MSKINGIQLSNLTNIFKLIFCLCSLALIFAYFVEFFLGFKPCILCIYERIIYGLIILPPIVFFILRRGARYLIIPMILFQLVQVGTAFYHVGVERNIFQPTKECMGDQSLDHLSFEDLSKKLQEKRLPSCSNPVYLLPNISMAEANLVFSLVILLLTLFFLKKDEIIRR